MARLSESPGVAVSPHKLTASKTGTGAEPFPRPPYKPPFMLLIHPDRWRVLDDAIVPRDSELVLQVGINAIVDSGGGELDWSPALARAAREGAVAIPFDVLKDRTDVPVEWRGHYLRAVPGNGDCAYHVCQRVFAGSSIVETVREDLVKWWAAVLQELDGFPKAPSAQVLRAMLAERRRDHASALQHAAQVPGRSSRRADGLAHEIAVIEAALAARAAKPKTKAKAEEVVNG